MFLDCREWEEDCRLEGLQDSMGWTQSYHSMTIEVRLLEYDREVFIQAHADKAEDDNFNEIKVVLMAPFLCKTYYSAI